MSRTRKIVAVAAGLVATVVVVALVTRAPSGWTRPAALEGRYEARYELSFEGRTSGSAQGGIRLVVRGALDVRRAGDVEPTRWLAAKLDVEAVEADDAAKRVTGFSGEGVIEGLESPWFLRLDDEGRVTEVRFGDETPVAARATLSSIAWGTQLARPKGTASDAWEADEAEINGPYRARYAASWTGSNIEKTWSIRTEGDPDDPEPLDAYNGEGTATFEVASERISRVRASLRGSVNVGGQKLDERAHYATAITLVRTGDAPAETGASLDPSKFVAFSIGQVPARRPSVASGETFDSLFETARVAGDKKDWQRRVLARNDLTRLVASDDRLADRTATMIRAGGHTEPTERTLIEALVGAATPAAQTQVASLIGDKALPGERRVRVLQATSLLKTPGPEVMRALEEASFVAGVDASLAAMTLGAAVHYLKDSDPRLAPRVSERLVEHAAAIVQAGPPPDATPKAPWKGATHAERVNWIGALGNAGLPEALPVLVELLHDENATIRASAAHSLRFMDPVAALPAMQEAMHDDKSITVRHALLHAARTMGPETMEAFVTRALMYDDSEHVRLGAAYAVAFWAIKAPGLRRNLAEALEREKSPKVRESLRNYLQPGRIEWPFRQVHTPGSEP